MRRRSNFQRAALWMSPCAAASSGHWGTTPRLLRCLHKCVARARARGFFFPPLCIAPAAEFTCVTRSCTAQRLFVAFDEDGDGIVTFNEFAVSDARCRRLAAAHDVSFLNRVLSCVVQAGVSLLSIETSPLEKAKCACVVVMVLARAIPLGVYVRIRWVC